MRSSERSAKNGRRRGKGSGKTRGGEVPGLFTEVSTFFGIGVLILNIGVRCASVY